MWNLNPQPKSERKKFKHHSTLLSLLFLIKINDDIWVKKFEIHIMNAMTFLNEYEIAYLLTITKL